VLNVHLKSFYGIFCLCRFQPHGLQYVSRNSRFILLSFFVVIPLYFATQPIQDASLRILVEIKNQKIAEIQQAGFVLFAFLWLKTRAFFALLSWSMKLDRHVWPTIGLINWLHLILLLPPALFSAIFVNGLISAGVYLPVMFIYQIYALTVLVFALRTALDAKTWQALVIIVLLAIIDFLVADVIRQTMGVF